MELGTQSWEDTVITCSRGQSPQIVTRLGHEFSGGNLEFGTWKLELEP